MAPWILLISIALFRKEKKRTKRSCAGASWRGWKIPKLVARVPRKGVRREARGSPLPTRGLPKRPELQIHLPKKKKSLKQRSLLLSLHRKRLRRKRQSQSRSKSLVLILKR